jgi:hypothetical protein
VEGAHPTLISPQAAEAFRKWEAAERDRQRSYRNQHHARGLYLLTGLVRCAHCGFHFVGSTRRKAGAHEWREYVCSG